MFKKKKEERKSREKNAIKTELNAAATHNGWV